MQGPEQISAYAVPTYLSMPPHVKTQEVCHSVALQKFMNVLTVLHIDLLAYSFYLSSDEKFLYKGNTSVWIITKNVKLDNVNKSLILWLTLKV